jgi:FixJ family two-component response regulator
VSAAGKIIAVIDDDESMLEAVDRLLSSYGFRTELYESGEAFIAAAMDSSATCLVCDIQLGDMTGVDLGRELSARALTFPVIYMSGSDDPAFRKEASALGGVAYLHKPFTAAQLEAAIADVLGQDEISLRGCCPLADRQADS